MMRNFKMIDLQTLRGKIDRQEDFVLLETLSKEEFDKGHLPGAKNLPVDEIETRANDVIPSKDAEVVVYCASTDCDASENAAKKLVSLGYTNIYDFPGGKAEWKAAEKTTVAT